MSKASLMEEKQTPRQPAEDLLADSAIPPGLWIDRIWMAVIVAVLYGVLFRVELISLMDTWTSSARESHGFIIPAFSLYFLYQERKNLSRTVGKPSYVGLLVLLGSVVAYTLSILTEFYYPRQILMLGALFGAVLFLGGWRIIRLTWLPILFLVFAMPLPARLYYMISMPLRQLASLVAAGILDVLPGTTAEATGVVISGSHAGDVFQLNVADACSGMRLLRAFLALGVAMAYLEKRPTWQRIVLLCSTIPTAVFCNMLRVLLTGLIHVYVGAEYATGTLHTLLGMVMLIVAFAIYGLLAWIMNRLFIEEEQEDVLVVQQEGSA